MKKIEITTTQNVVIEYELATTIDRSVAFILDTFFIGIFGVITYYFSLAFIGNMSFATILIVIVSLFYHLFFEVFVNGQSPGKMIMGIKVVKINRAHVSFYDYLMRWALRSVELVGSACTIAVLFSSASEKGQRIGDVLADTSVIKINKDSIFSLQRLKQLQNRKAKDFEPQYPLLKHLTDADMIIIKEVIERASKHKNTAHKEALDETCEHLKKVLQIKKIPMNKIKFLNEIMREYVIMTR